MNGQKPEDGLGMSGITKKVLVLGNTPKTGRRRVGMKKVKKNAVSAVKNRLGDLGEGIQANACGKGLLSEVEGLEGIREAAVWTVNSCETLYRVDGKFWMGEDRTLGDPARQVIHYVAEVSVDQARKFLSKHSEIVEMGDIKDRIAQRDRKDGVVK